MAAALLALGCSRSDALPGPVDPLSPDTPASIDLFVSAPSAVVGQVVEVSSIVRNSAGSPLPGAVTTYAVDNGTVARIGDPGEIYALAVGTTNITASTPAGAGSITATAALRVDPPASTSSTSWTFCVNAGQSCDFTGLRRVRLGASGGPFVEQVAYGTVPCATYGFGGQDPAPNHPLHCDIGPVLTTTLNNPTPGMGIAGATVVVPLGAPGDGAQRVRPTSDLPVVTDGTGSFRTTCQLSHMAFDDPVVYPGRPGASHLHAFFGNTTLRASSTVESNASSGNSTCRGGIVNRTGYWVPAIVDAGTGEVQVPEDGIFYYKSGYNMDPQTIQPFPAGLRMIAGDKNATGAQDNVGWGCRDHFTGSSATIPANCPAGDYVRLEVQFPQCWDGQHLDSPDHKSHMAFPDYRNAPQRSTCPASHPVPLPAITEKFDYAVTGHTPSRWRLSSDMYAAGTAGGLSAHADWFNGWIPAFMQQIVTQCLHRAVDCGVASLGNGTELY